MSGSSHPDGRGDLCVRFGSDAVHLLQFLDSTEPPVLLSPRENGLGGYRPYPGQLLELRLAGMVQIKRPRRCSAAATRLGLISDFPRRVSPGTDHHLLAVAQRLGEIELTRISSIGQPTCGVDGVLDSCVLRQPDQTRVPDGAEDMDNDLRNGPARRGCGRRRRLRWRADRDDLTGAGYRDWPGAEQQPSGRQQTEYQQDTDDPKVRSTEPLSRQLLHDYAARRLSSLGDPSRSRLCGELRRLLDGRKPRPVRSTGRLLSQDER